MKNIKKYVRGELFKITLTNNIIDIENFTDIKNISKKEIIIYTDKKKIIITGDDLNTKKLMHSEIMIMGNTQNISFKDINE